MANGLIGKICCSTNVGFNQTRILKFFSLKYLTRNKINIIEKNQFKMLSYLKFSYLSKFRQNILKKYFYL